MSLKYQIDSKSNQNLFTDLKFPNVEIKPTDANFISSISFSPSWSILSPIFSILSLKKSIIFSSVAFLSSLSIESISFWSLIILSFLLQNPIVDMKLQVK